MSSVQYTRKIFLVFVVLAYIFVYSFRMLYKGIVIRNMKSIIKQNAVLLVTTEDMAEAMVTRVQKKSNTEIKIVGLVLLDKSGRVGESVNGIKIVCQLDDIPDYIQIRWVDFVLINSGNNGTVQKNLIETCINMGVMVHNCLADVDRNSNTQYVDRFGGYVVLSSSLRIAEEKQFLLKRLLDICGGVVGLVFTAIFTIIIGPMIYIASPGPIFFSQTRIGRNGRRFKIYKFRSMYMDAEERKKELMEKNEMQGLMFKIDADPRIIGSGPDGTRHGLGWFIRKTSIDEFPQFLNVLRGDMSLVGTRPPTEDEWMQYEQHHRARMVVKPGLTGMWQVSGRSDITDFEEVVALDMEYVERWNVFFDLKLLFKTVQVVVLGKGSK